MKDLNQKVISLIDKYGNDYRSALRAHVNLEYFMALSPLRENLLEWYEFRRDASLLQAGADFGALTGLFRQRVNHVEVWDESEESLDVVRARFPEVKKEAEQPSASCALSLTSEPLEKIAAAGKRYDYVVCAGSLREPVSEWAELLKSLLKPGGTLLLAACNRFGLKYFAGALRDSVSVMRGQLAGLFPGCEFYYPMPDYRVPSVIYSDRCLPARGELAGMHPLYDFPEYPFTDVGADFEAACEDGQFGNFADSFLIIWEKGE